MRPPAVAGEITHTSWLLFRFCSDCCSYHLPRLSLMNLVPPDSYWPLCPYFTLKPAVPWGSLRGNTAYSFANG